MEFEEKTLYQPKEVSKITGVESSTLNKWANRFNLDTEWTLGEKKGHRRYTKENIEEVLQLKKLIVDKKMDWDAAEMAFRGIETEFIVDQTKTRIEKQLEKNYEKTAEVLEATNNIRDFNMELVNQLKLITQELVETKKELQEVKNENANLSENLKLEVQLRNKALDEYETMKDTISTTKEKKGFFSSLFRK
ncbi:MerR family transcriptional regulator [Bacillus sp. 1P06AnD]|uniref:MerR family transcriptional regulator n=1 Tax=Bacillus sp. 1P06AnD TaxID=3132208 RepID=UPI0039A39999